MTHSFEFETRINHKGQAGHYWMRQQSLSEAFCLALSPRMADLLDVSMAIYAADRQSPRNHAGARTGRRTIEVRVGLREPGHWSSESVNEKLLELLSWLTEDAWSFEFVARKASPSIAESARFLFPLPPAAPVSVALFSGGLDSLAGLALHAREQPGRSYALVSGYTHSRLALQQRELVAHVRKSFRHNRLTTSEAEIRHVAVPFGIYKYANLREERSQRSRSLVFLAIGATAALQANSDTLHVFENGVGALNLPQDDTQLGVDNYRGVHPRSLMMAADLFEVALEQPFRIKNPCLFQTKGEMCQALYPLGLLRSVAETTSCDGFPQRAPQPQCGYCTSCVLRRQALYVAGIQDSEMIRDVYRHDVFGGRADLTPEQSDGFASMRNQARWIADCLATQSPWNSLVAAFPELLRTHCEFVARGVQPGRVRAGIIGLLRTYALEWERLPADLALAA